MDLQIFKNSGWEVRAVERNGGPWFVASDVCSCLGYSNPSKSISDHVDEDDRYNESLERGGSIVIINESGLYSLILRSRKQEAKKFKKWVTSEVLPSIRKTGGYIATKEDDTPEQIMARAILVAQETIANKDKLIKELEPKAEFVDQYVDATGLYTLTATAKNLKVKRKDLIALLERDKFIFRRSGRIEPYAEKVKQGLFEVKAGERNGHSFMQVYLTTKGVERIASTYMSELAE